MATMTDVELHEIIRNPPPGELKVSVSRAGIFFTAGDVTRKITDDQADLLWRMLPLMAQLSAAQATQSATEKL